MFLIYISVLRKKDVTDVTFVTPAIPPCVPERLIATAGFPSVAGTARVGLLDPETRRP